MKHTWAVRGFLLLVLVTLGSYALLGWHSRLIADDYCQFDAGLRFGPVGAVTFFNTTWNGLYSLSFISGLLAPAALPVIQTQTLLLIVGFGVTIYLLLAELERWAQRSAPRWQWIVITLFLTLVAMVSAPNIRNLVWFSVVYQNTLTVCLMIAAAVWMLRLTRVNPSPAVWVAGAVGLGLTAFVLTGFANTFFLPMMGLLGLAFLLTVFRLSGERRQRMAALLLTLMLVTGLSFVLVFTAPGNAIRQAEVLRQIGHAVPDLSRLIQLTVHWTIQYVVHPWSVIYTLLIFLVGVLLITEWNGSHAQALAALPAPQSIGWFAGLILLAVVIVVIGTIVTTVYGLGVIPSHTMFFPRIAQTLGAAALGYLFVVWAARRGFPQPAIIHRPVYRLVRLALIVMLAFLPLRTLAFNLWLLPSFQAYAADWDAADARLRAAEGGVVEIEAYRFSVAEYLDLQEIDEPDGFVQACAASFHNVERIVVVPRTD